jgi:Protein of unknown function (DUF1549)/Protein of unknown function (DUF1553)
MNLKSSIHFAVAILVCLVTCHAFGTEPTNTSVAVAPIYERFAPDASGQLKTDETPSFQKHVSPLLGRLGCNGRSCHGSFQGQGGFRLSLFGYDFQSDYDALLEKGHDRVNREKVVESLILSKPIDADNHEGGKRFNLNSWEYWVLRRWIESGDTYDAQEIQRIQSLDVTPKELRFTDKGQSIDLKVVAHWEDGSVEDVTSLCRFQSNDSAVASINAQGVVTSGERGDTHVVVSYDNAVVPILAMRPMSDQIDEKFPPIEAPTNIDRLVIEKLRKLGIVPSAISNDEEFLRRVSLDMTGTLPTSSEVLAFCSDMDPAKRQKKIEELLTRPGYVAQWTTFLCDMTGNNDDQLRNFFPQGIDPSSQWYRWIYERVEQNMPYDEIVEGIVTAVSRLPNESYREYCEAMTQACKDNTGEKFAERPGLVHFWARNNFKTTEDRVIGFAYSFLGVRIQCAQCHKHPFDQWSKSDFDNFERLFGGVQANQNSLASDAKKDYTALLDELKIDKTLKGNQLRKAIGEMLKSDPENRVYPFPELLVNSKVKGKKGKEQDKEPVATKAKLLGGDWIELDSKDVRGKLMDWLRSESNPYFAKAIVNRIWAAYFGVGIVNPPDDLNLANAPSNAALLDYLANGFREHQFDMKWLHREIVNSHTYQRSWVTNETNEFDKRNFSHSLLRRLPAEATHDAVRMALINDQLVESAQRLEVNRAITRGGASSQAPRDDMTYALSVFGRSIRESNCDCDRSTEPSLLQTVFLLNDKAVLSWLNDPKDSWVASVAEKYGWQTPRGQATPGNDKRNDMAGRLPEQLEKLQKQLEKAETKLAQAQASGQEQLVESLRQRKEQALKQKERLEKLIADPEKVATRLQADLENASKSQEDQRMTEEQALWITEQAYLRALSRKPKPNETQVSMGYLRTESNPTMATENLIWSLLNTKEFIINH